MKEKVTAFLAKHGGNAESAVTDLLTDNLRYRERLRSAQNTETPYKPDARIVELEAEVDKLEGENVRLGNLIPAQGAVVLVGDDVKAYEAFKALGKPEDVKKQLEELPVLRGKVATVETSTAATEAAKLLGWNPDATVGAINDKGLVVSLVDGKDKDGKAIKVPHVRPKADEKAATVPLADWVTTHAAYLTPALTAKTTPTGGSGGSSSNGAPQGGTPFPAQSAGGTPAATGDPVADFQKNSQAARDSRPSPFAPRKAAATT